MEPAPAIVCGKMFLVCAMLTGSSYFGYGQLPFADDSLEARIDYVETYYSYQNLDSATYYFDEIATTAAARKQWKWLHILTLWCQPFRSI